MRTCACGINHFRPIERHPKDDAWKCSCGRWVYPTHVMYPKGDHYEQDATDKDGHSVRDSSGYRAYDPVRMEVEL